MRKIMHEEEASWRALARCHGFGIDEDRFMLGRFVAEDRWEGGLVLRAVTPIPACFGPANTTRNPPPIMFDRTTAGEIVVPGRWWQLMFEQVCEDAAAPAKMRQMAATMAITTTCRDLVLPAGTDTVAIDILDAQGNMVTCEALPPGSRIQARIQTNSGAQRKRE